MAYKVPTDEKVYEIKPLEREQIQHLLRNFNCLKASKEARISQTTLLKFKRGQWKNLTIDVWYRTSHYLRWACDIKDKD